MPHLVPAPVGGRAQAVPPGQGHQQGQPTADGVVITQRLTQVELATMVGGALALGLAQTRCGWY